MENLKQVDDKLNLDRTDKLFDSSISRSGSNDQSKYTDEDIKKQRLVIGFGNLHVNTAKLKVSVVRMRGYRDNVTNLKRAVDRKVRKERKYGRRAD